jgi:hypothetical protein
LEQYTPPECFEISELRDANRATESDWRERSNRMQMAMRHFSGARYDDKGEIGVVNHHLALAVFRVGK